MDGYATGEATCLAAGSQYALVQNMNGMVRNQMVRIQRERGGGKVTCKVARGNDTWQISAGGRVVAVVKIERN
jgi:hypothetical protein